MGFGLIMVTGCVVFLALMTTDSNEKFNVKERTSKPEITRKKSKWD